MRNNRQQTHEKKFRGEQSLRPVTIKQVINTKQVQPSVFQIDGRDISQITLIGVIRNIVEQQTNVSYNIEDGTGSIEVRKWSDQNESAQEMERRRRLNIDQYVRVVGRINSFNDRINVMAFDIRPITDFNEITYHLLDTVYNHLNFTKGNSGPKDDPMQITLDSIHDQIYNIIQSDHSEDGVHLDQIKRSLRSTYTDAEIRASIEHLSIEGRCYSTIDDNHFKSTESDVY
ncbi:unnamed protein product [Cunninghamella echinulata]